MKLPDIRRPAAQFKTLSFVFIAFLIAGCGGSGSSPHLNWTSKAAMPTARNMLASGVVNGKIYAIGGYTGTYSNQTIVANVEEYDPATDTWATKASMPTARKGLSSAVVNNVIYAVGGGPAGSAAHTGNCNGNCSTLESYDPASDTWTTQAPALTQRNGMTGSAVNTIIYVMGGCCSTSIPNASINTVEAYDTATNTWATKSSMPTAREGLTSAVVNGKIYAIGGGTRDANNNTISTSTVEVYDPPSDTWATKAPMPTARKGLSSAVVNGKIYVIGGVHGTSPAPAISSVEVYDPGADTWTSISSNYSMPTARSDLISEVVNGTIFAIGGYDSTSLSTVEAFTPP